MPSSWPLPSLANPAGRLTICWLPEIQAIAAASSELTASVAMNDGIRARVIISQEKIPTAAPASSDSTTAAAIGTWPTSSRATRIAPSPTSAPIARSITPARGGDHQADRHQAGDRLVGQQRPPGPRGQERVGDPQREHHEHERQQVQRRHVPERHRPPQPSRPRLTRTAVQQRLRRPVAGGFGLRAAAPRGGRGGHAVDQLGPPGSFARPGGGGVVTDQPEDGLPAGHRRPAPCGEADGDQQRGAVEQVGDPDRAGRPAAVP